MTLFISDQAEEFRIEISGRFADSAVTDAATAWKTALLANTPRRISVDITRMTGYDHAGLTLLCEVYKHGTHIAAATPRSLLFLNQISNPRQNALASAFSEDPAPQTKRSSNKQVFTMPRPIASGE